MFIHSASGQVTEQDLSVTSPDDVKGGGDTHKVAELPQGGVVPEEGEELADPSLSHNYTTTKSEAMEMTCETAPAESSTKPEEEPYVEQVTLSSTLVWVEGALCGAGNPAGALIWVKGPFVEQAVLLSRLRGLMWSRQNSYLG